MKQSQQHRVSNDIRDCLPFKRAHVILEWLDYLNMSWCHAGQVNWTIAWAFGRLSSFSQSSFHFCCRKSMPWEIRYLQQVLISEDGFFVAVALLPNVRKNTVFLHFKKQQLYASLLLCRKEILSTGSEKTSAIFSFFKNKRKMGILRHLWDAYRTVRVGL